MLLTSLGTTGWWHDVGLTVDVQFITMKPHVFAAGLFALHNWVQRLTSLAQFLGKLNSDSVVGLFKIVPIGVGSSANFFPIMVVVKFCYNRARLLGFAGCSESMHTIKDYILCLFFQLIGDEGFYFLLAAFGDLTVC